MARPRRTFEVVRDDQIEVMASPARLEILDAVRSTGPCSIADIAALLGRPADSLYYHVRQLVEVDLLIPCGTRPTSRRHEELYRTPARRIRTPFAADDPKEERSHHQDFCFTAAAD